MNTSKFQFDLERTETFKRVRKNSAKCFVGKQISNYNLQGVRRTDLFFRLVLQTKLVRVSFKLTSIIWVIFVSESKLLRAKLPTARIAS